MGCGGSGCLGLAGGTVYPGGIVGEICDTPGVVCDAAGVVMCAGLRACAGDR